MKLKQLFCKHKWVYNGTPYLWDMGRTKRVDVKCNKCGKASNKDIFDLKLIQIKSQSKQMNN